MDQIEKKCGTDVVLENEVSHLPELLPSCSGNHYLEQNAFAIIGESGDYDIMSTYLSYVVGGKAWGVDRQNLRLAAFMAIPKSMRGKMHDNDFISNRVDPIHGTGEMLYLKEKDSVTLDIAGQKIIARPPYWQLTGAEFHGVQYDVVATANGPATWTLGKYEDIVKNGMAGYDQSLSFTGSITAYGQKFELGPDTKGSRQYVTIGDKWINGDLLKRFSRHAYIWVISKEAEAFVWVKDAMNLVTGRTVVDKNTYNYDPSSVQVEELDHWVDPRTGIYLPVRWRVKMESDGNRADLIVTAYARYIYSFCQTDGICTYCNFLSRADGEIIQNGRRIEIKDARAKAETGIFTIPLGIV